MRCKLEKISRVVDAVRHVRRADAERGEFPWRQPGIGEHGMQGAIGGLIVLEELRRRAIKACPLVIFDAGFELDRRRPRPEIGGEVRRELADHAGPFFQISGRAAPPPCSGFGRTALAGREIPWHVFEGNRDVLRPIPD